MNGLHIARGDDIALPESPIPTIPLKGVSPEQWARFIAAMSVQGLSDVSASGGLGKYAIRPRRLVEIKVMSNLRVVRNSRGRQVHDGDFVLPLTREKFLRSRLSPVIQYDVLVKSIADHASTPVALCAGMTASGALAVLHRAGRGGLESWGRGRVFDETLDLYYRTNGIF